MNRNNRPPIPAELRRRVLLESGHRCAIPTCKFPDIDVHHIIPWSKCLEHQFDNLIALCPNCHRRAHNGEIDRKSLLLYKSRLVALFGKEMLKQPVTEGSTKIYIKSTPCNYTAEVYSDVSEEHNYSINIEYPKFHFKEASFVNEEIQSKIIEIAQSMVDHSKDPQRVSSRQYYVDGSFHIGLNTPLIISLRSELANYGGGAHGSSWTEAFNFRLDQHLGIHIENIFSVSHLGIEALSDYSIDAVMKLQPYRDKDNVKSGAGPERKNFEQFNFTPEGILLAFGEYQLGCYAEGPAEILVPYAAIRPFVSDFMENLINDSGEIVVNE